MFEIFWMNQKHYKICLIQQRLSHLINIFVCLYLLPLSSLTICLFVTNLIYVNNTIYYQP